MRATTLLALVIFGIAAIFMAPAMTPGQFGKKGGFEGIDAGAIFDRMANGRPSVPISEIRWRTQAEQYAKDKGITNGMLTREQFIEFQNQMRSLMSGGAKREVNELKIKELQKERLATTRELAKLVAQRFKNNQGIPEEQLEATRLLFEAELDVCDSAKERIAVLEKFLAAAKDNEKIATQFHETGQGRESTMLGARAERLRVEIALERAKAKKDAPPNDTPAKEKAIQPKNGKVQSLSLPCSIEAFESVRLSARIAGFLKSQTVDIGDRVKRGQVLALVDAPDMEAQVRHDQAAVDQARTRVTQARARVGTAKADLETVKLTVKQTEAAAKSAGTGVRYRTLQHQRMNELFASKSIDQRLLDESKERLEAALEAEQSAQAAVATAKSHVLAAMTKIEQAEADAAATEAGVKIAQANLEKSQVQLSFATITAPFDGVITQCGYFAGAFIRSANQAGNHEPLFTVQRTDRMRVVLAIPDRDAPLIDVGKTAEVEIDALPGKKWSAKVSRSAATLDPQTRCMRVELDLPNPTGQLRQGMHGKVTIVLDK